MVSEIDSLDWKSTEIIRALDNADGPLTTTELRETTDLEKNRIILYRISEYLEPENLVTTHQPAASGTVVPAKEITLTEAGREVAAEFEAKDNHELTLTDLPEKVQQLSDRLDKTQTEIDRRESRTQSAKDESLDELHEQVENQQAQLADIAYTVATFDTESHGAWNDTQQEEFRRLRHGMYAIRNYLFDETDLDPDRLEAYIDDVADDE